MFGLIVVGRRGACYSYGYNTFVILFLVRWCRRVSNYQCFICNGRTPCEESLLSWALPVLTVGGQRSSLSWTHQQWIPACYFLIQLRLTVGGVNCKQPFARWVCNLLNSPFFGNIWFWSSFPKFTSKAKLLRYNCRRHVIKATYSHIPQCE